MPQSQTSPDRQRLLDLSRERGASLSRLSELLGRNPAYLQQFIKRGTPRKLEEGDRRTLARFFGVDEQELAGGADKEISYDKRPQGSDSSSPDDYIEVPRLMVGASAGPGALASGEAIFDAFRFSRRWLSEHGLENAKLSAITVEGDSMEPLLNDGDEILVDRAPRAFRDGVHVVRLDDTLMVKRVASAGAGKFALLSQNLAYPPLTVGADELEIIGRVVWKGGRI